MVAADWPTHTDKDWQRVVELAYDYGWQKPYWTSAHPTLILDCPDRDPHCRLRANGSGKAASGPARTALRQIPRCPHRKIEAPLAKADNALDTAERLIRGAETLVARSAAYDKVEELLELVAEAVDEAAKELEKEFDEADEQLTALDAEVEELVEESTEVAAVVASAGPPLREAKVTIASLPARSPEVMKRQTRLDVLVARRDALRD